MNVIKNLPLRPIGPVGPTQSEDTPFTDDAPPIAGGCLEPQPAIVTWIVCGFLLFGSVCFAIGALATFWIIIKHSTP